jgi:hypothetical protein
MGHQVGGPRAVSWSASGWLLRFVVELTVSLTIWAVLQGTVDFSTKIAPGLAAMAISRVAPSSATMLVADPAPIPVNFVGVFTLRKTISASEIDLATSVEKNKLGRRAGISTFFPVFSSLTTNVGLVPSRATRTISFRPGSWMGKCLEFHFRTRFTSLSTTVTLMPGLWNATTAAVGPPRKF